MTRSEIINDLELIRDWFFTNELPVGMTSQDPTDVLRAAIQMLEEEV